MVKVHWNVASPAERNEMVACGLDLAEKRSYDIGEVTCIPCMKFIQSYAELRVEQLKEERIHRELPI